jgi:hypothetical protein
MRSWLLVALIALALDAAGCGGADSSDDSTQQPALPAQAPSDDAFPTNGTTTGPNVVTTPGTAATKESGQAGGGSGATCIGC